MGFEPMNTGFADQRVSHFAIGAHAGGSLSGYAGKPYPRSYFGCAAVRRYGFTVL